MRIVAVRNCFEPISSVGRHTSGKADVSCINDSGQHHVGLTVAAARAQKRRCRVWASWSIAGSSVSWP
jgi:hypothetical protein